MKSIYIHLLTQPLKYGLHVVFVLALTIGCLPKAMMAQTESWFKNPVPDSYNLGYVTTGDYWYSMAFGDLDNDGDEDLLVVKLTLTLPGFEFISSIYYHENIGTPTLPLFAPADSSNTFGISELELFDFFEFIDIDADGDLDIFATTRNYDQILYVENTGTPAMADFSESQPLTNPFRLNSGEWVSRVSDLTFGDFDDDGDLDVLINGRMSGDELVYQENIGTPQEPLFRSYRPINMDLVTSGPLDTRSQLYDWDCDGDLDILSYYVDLNTDKSHVVFLENIGSPQAERFEHYTNRYVKNAFRLDLGGFGFLNWLRYVDIDGDGDLDAFTPNGFHRNIHGCGGFFEERADFGGFIKMPETGDGDLHTTELADLDSDGDMDMFVMTLKNTEDSCHLAGAKSIDYFENIAEAVDLDCPEFEWRDSFPFGLDKNLGYMKFIDIDGDEDLDVFGLKRCSTEMLFQENHGTPEAPDFNGQGVEANPFGIDPPGANVEGPVPCFGDFDNDGDYDLFVGGRTAGKVVYQENIGSAESPEFGGKQIDPFELTLPYIPQGAILINAFDHDCDEDLDLFVTMSSDDFDGGSMELFFFENIGTADNPVFARPIATGDAFFPMTFADMDGDGDEDALGSFGAYYRNVRTTTCTQLPYAVISVSGEGSNRQFDAGHSTYLNSECNPPQFLWDFGDGSPVVDELAPIHSFPSVGEYQVVLTLVDIAGRSFASELIDITVAVREVEDERTLMIYPNPASNRIHIRHKGDINTSSCMISLYDSRGREIYRDIASFAEDSVVEVELIGLTPGLYTVAVTDGKMRFTGQVVVVPE